MNLKQKQTLLSLSKNSSKYQFGIIWNSCITHMTPLICISCMLQLDGVVYLCSRYTCMHASMRTYADYKCTNIHTWTCPLPTQVHIPLYILPQSHIPPTNPSSHTHKTVIKTVNKIKMFKSGCNCNIFFLFQLSIPVIRTGAQFHCSGVLMLFVYCFSIVAKSSFFSVVS
jgi:hypothetical protein